MSAFVRYMMASHQRIENMRRRTEKEDTLDDELLAVAAETRALIAEARALAAERELTHAIRRFKLVMLLPAIPLGLRCRCYNCGQGVALLKRVLAMSKFVRRHRDHVGAKNGGGFWGKRAEAKQKMKKSRRQVDATKEQVPHRDDLDDVRAGLDEAERGELPSKEEALDYFLSLTSCRHSSPVTIGASVVSPRAEWCETCGALRSDGDWVLPKEVELQKSLTKARLKAR